MEYELIAAVDLGSNSFRLQVGRVVGNQIYPLDGLKESVRLAAGLNAEKILDGESQLRALEALKRFGERLRGFAPGAVRAVATNTLRVAKNAPQFLLQADAALGFPIEVIAGREEARLIYVGVAHTLADPHTQQLVMDIGGGSTEFIIGRAMQPLRLESLYMGCVSFSLRYFPDGAVDKRSMKEAELAARQELQTIVHPFRETGWDEAIGSSGSARAILDLLELNGLSERVISRDGLAELRSRLVRAGNVSRLDMAGLRPERIPVLPGAVAIMSAAFKEFDLEQMAFSEGALRLGVLYDLLGRYHHADLREATVENCKRRYEVDRSQSARVEATALRLLRQLQGDDGDTAAENVRLLTWAARLHEVGISVAHSSYHRHSAYILANADMPGFSRRDQTRLAGAVLGHRGKLERAADRVQVMADWLPVFALRTAAMLHRARTQIPEPPLDVSVRGNILQVAVDVEWIESSPLSAASLEEEVRQWATVGLTLVVHRIGSRKRTIT